MVQGTCAVFTSNVGGGGHSGTNGVRQVRSPGAQLALDGRAPDAQLTRNSRSARTQLTCAGARQCGAARSSTVGWGGEPDRAIDRSTDSDWSMSSCTHTDAGPESTNENHVQHGVAWWQIDMGGMAQVDKVNIWHRTDCCQDRLESAQIYVSQQSNVHPTTGAFNPQGAQLCGTLSDHTNVPEVSQCNLCPIGRQICAAQDTFTPRCSSATDANFDCCCPGNQYVTVAHTQQAGHVTTGTR